MKKVDQARALTKESGVENVGGDASSPTPFWVYVRLLWALRNEKELAEEERMDTSGCGHPRRVARRHRGPGGRLARPSCLT